MTDAGFFRGTSADQDNRFANKQKKLLKEFSPILNTKLNMSKIDIESLKPWIEEKIKDVLEKDDEILSDSIYEHLAGKEPDGKDLFTLITGLVEDNDQKASKFMEELWTKLIETQENSNGLIADHPTAAITNTDADTDTVHSPGNGVSTESRNTQNDDEQVAEDGSQNDDKPTDRPSRSASRSPRSQEMKDDQQQRSPHNRDQVSPDKSPRGSAKSVSASKSRSRSRSSSKSRSRTGRSSSRSGSRSHSISKSKSVSRSPRRSRSRSRSPYRHRQNRFRRSHSRSDSFHPRSRSPRGGRGGFRGGFRGSGYQDRRRGFMGPMRRRPSPPWNRRRYSSRSPSIRRRRTPPMSPRRRSRSPPPYRRRSRSPRSPPSHHMMARRSPPLRQYPMGPTTMDMGPRHMHHDIHRPVIPPVSQRSPRGLDHRGAYNDRHVLPRHSPIMGRSHDMRHPPHSLIPTQPGPSQPYSRSPSSSPDRKKHKKDKKHKKHKKSKKHRSASPDRKKKHKKHKKSKKHKS